MTSSAIIFMVLSWTFVLGLTFWSFARVMRHEKEPPPRFDRKDVAPTSSRRT